MPAVSQTDNSAIHLYPTPTQKEYILCDDTIVIIVGPMGEGKTLASIMALFRHAQRCKPYLPQRHPLNCAVIRDTHENIKHSVVKSFNEFFASHEGLGYKWKNDFKQLDIYSDPPIHCDLFGIDDTAALTRLQGSQYGLIWAEECAPYTDSYRTNAGISEDVFNAALVRCARQVGVPPRLQLSSNPCDEDHWMFRRLIKIPDGSVSPEAPLITKRIFNIPYGENRFLPEVSRQATKAAFAQDSAAYDRFVRGLYATKYPGKKVAENFNDRWHVCEYPLDPVEGLDGWMAFDSWGNPVCVLGQQYPDGRIVVLDVLEDAADLRGLIHDQIAPRLLHPRWHTKVRQWRHLGDCTMIQHDQSNIESSAARLIEESFTDTEGRDAIFEPGPSTWHLIKNGLLHTLRWTVKGGPAVLLDPVHCKSLISSLKGQWHYPVNKSGAVTSNKPAKGDASHRADAFANACCVLMPWSPPTRASRQYDNSRAQTQQRARSYATT